MSIAVYIVMEEDPYNYAAETPIAVFPSEDAARRFISGSERPDIMTIKEVSYYE